MQPTYDELVQLCYALETTLTGLAQSTTPAIEQLAQHSISLRYRDPLPPGYVSQLAESLQGLRQHIPGVEQL